MTELLQHFDSTLNHILRSQSVPGSLSLFFGTCLALQILLALFHSQLLNVSVLPNLFHINSVLHLKVSNICKYFSNSNRRLFSLTNHCVKYARIRVFSGSYLQNHRFSPYMGVSERFCLHTGEYGSDKTRLLAHFTNSRSECFLLRENIT